MGDPAPQLDPNLDLSISRLLRARRDAIWRCWTEPELLREWWCPSPWTTEVRAFDLRPGGAFHTFMRGPDGGTSDNPGCFLEIVPGRRIVFTDDLEMNALERWGGLAERAARALAAGCDGLLICRRLEEATEVARRLAAPALEARRREAAARWDAGPPP